MIFKQWDDTALVHLCGSLTHADFERFNAVLDHLSRAAPSTFVLDLSDVNFIDSSGIGMLLMAQELAEHRECLCRLRGVGPAAWAILEQAHVSDLFEVDPHLPGLDPDGSGIAAA
ncbi:STAS domain-containing protein [Roseospira navarrensis]|uniref:STAS domain-containing protein n=1 Tax=Roseospira navarrensis TaxID=140058 RepID=A0A7X2D2D0_9PROT|nr:STAS domain-containing protein [Roseospira navarrensis]MQX35556.1 STAS domain-containing protein [Roseospira navarrensis]